MKVYKDKIVVENDKFNAFDTILCGQVFSFKIVDNTIFVVSGKNYAKIVVEKITTSIYSTNIDYFYNFFDFSTDYDNIKKKLCEIYPNFDKYLVCGKDLKILRQDPLQTIISFIVSSNNNIKRITKSLSLLCEKFGDKLPNDLFAFPTLKQLEMVSVEDFRKIGCGYRSEYLVQSIKMLGEKDFEIETLKLLPTKELREKLMELKGVGRKVADCILFFGFCRTDVFPVDTWIRKAYKDFCDLPRSDSKIADYFVDLFGKYSGYAQQYVYNFMLQKGKIKLQKE